MHDGILHHNKITNTCDIFLVAGLALGLSPAGLLLCDANAAASFVSQHSSSPFVAWELSLLLGILRCCWETVELMASGTLALQVGAFHATCLGWLT